MNCLLKEKLWLFRNTLQDSIRHSSSNFYGMAFA